MIEVNLLPEDRRPVERTPLPRFLTILVGVLGFSIEGLLLVLILADYPRKQDLLKSIQKRMDVAQVGIDQIDELEEKIDGYEKRNGEILQLYEHRRTWAPLLHRLSEPDVLPRNIWYSEIEFAKGKASRQQQAPEELVLSGYARGSSDDTNTSPMYQAIRVFAENLATDNTEFAEQFVGKPAKDDKGTELVDISPPKEAPANAPKKAVKFGLKLTVKPKKVVETKKRK